MGLGKAGLEPDCLAVLSDRLLQLSLVTQRVAEVVMSVGEVGLEPDCLAAFRDRPV